MWRGRLRISELSHGPRFLGRRYAHETCSSASRQLDRGRFPRDGAVRNGIPARALRGVRARACARPVRAPCQTDLLTFSRWFYVAIPGGRHGGTWRPPPHSTRLRPRPHLRCITGPRGVAAARAPRTRRRQLQPRPRPQAYGNGCSARGTLSPSHFLHSYKPTFVRTNLTHRVHHVISIRYDSRNPFSNRNSRFEPSRRVSRSFSGNAFSAPRPPTTQRHAKRYPPIERGLVIGCGRQVLISSAHPSSMTSLPSTSAAATTPVTFSFSAPRLRLAHECGYSMTARHVHSPVRAPRPQAASLLRRATPAMPSNNESPHS